MRARLGRASLALVLALALAGCPSKRAERDRSDRPDPVACETAADCAPGPFVNPDDVCCDTGMHLSVFSRKYLDWRARVVAAECKKAECPPRPSPALPSPCATEPRCVDRRCTHSCTP